MFIIITYVAHNEEDDNERNLDDTESRKRFYGATHVFGLFLVFMVDCAIVVVLNACFIYISIR